MTAPSQTSQTMFGFAGALWAFCGVAVLALFKDVVITELSKQFTPAYWQAIRAVVQVFFCFNGLAIFVTQSCGLFLLKEERPDLKCLHLFGLWFINAVFIVAYAWFGTKVLAATHAFNAAAT